MKDAEKVIERILYLDGVPNLQRLAACSSARPCPSSTASTSTSRRPRSSATTGASPWPGTKGDNGTAELLEDLLVGEEHHADWLESQLYVIDQIGIENYLAQHLHD